MLELIFFTYFPLFVKVSVIVDTSEAEDFSEFASKPLRSLPYDSPGKLFVAFEKPHGAPVTGKFSNTLKFIMKEVYVKSVHSMFVTFLFASLICNKNKVTTYYHDNKLFLFT